MTCVQKVRRMRRFPGHTAEEPATKEGCAPPPDLWKADVPMTELAEEIEERLVKPTVYNQFIL
jgi:hypothetical protein